jgi:SAM-dependent methyltransferase
MAAEFDQYVRNYRDIINERAAITGESFEYFIALRLRLLDGALRSSGVQAPRAILDFGCGIGATAATMREQFPNASVAGIDPSPESIRAAEALGVRDARFHVGDGESLPFPSATFDVVYSNGTFHHIDPARHPRIFAEIARVLRPGGSMFIFENNPLNPLAVRGMRLNPFDRGTKMLFPWYLRRMIQQAGLQARAPYYYVFYPKQLKVLRWSEPYLRRLPLGAQYYVWGTKR